MTNDSPERGTDTGTGADADAPTLRQRLHSATGDRDAEAEALADRAGDGVSDEDAKVAVELAHGDLGNEGTDAETELASAQDARAVSDERNDEPGGDQRR